MNKYISDNLRISDTIKWIIGIVFVGGMIYSSVLQIPIIERKTEKNTTDIAILKSDSIDTKDMLKEMRADIKTLLRRR